jgi:general secretion pathway protein L
MQGWRELALRPPFGRLVPRLPVLLVEPGGGRSLRDGASSRVVEGAKPRAAALALPDEVVLLRELTLPLLPADELRSALELEVAAVSPFPPDATAWGWRAAPQADPASDRLEVTLAIAARDHVDGRLAAATLPDDLPVEVWARSDGEPILLRGFGEATRERAERRRLATLVGLSLFALCLLVVLAAVPVLHARERTIDAQEQFDAVRLSAAEALERRELLVRRQQQVGALQDYLGQPADLLALIERLTDLIPDDAYATRFSWSAKDGASLDGLAADAAALIERISAEPDLSLVRAPSAISRDRRSGLETYSVVIDWRRDTGRGERE